MLELVLDVISSILLLAGGLLSLSAGLALLRFDDQLARMHAATKPQVLGLLFMLQAAALQMQGLSEITGLILVGMFQLVTAPVTANIVGRAAYHDIPSARDNLFVDDLDRDHPVLD